MAEDGYLNVIKPPLDSVSFTAIAKSQTTGARAITILHIKHLVQVFDIIPTSLWPEDSHTKLYYLNLLDIVYSVLCDFVFLCDLEDLRPLI